MSPGRCATSAAAQSSSARCAINRRIALSRRVTPAPPRPERRSTMRSIAWQAPSFAAKSADLGQDRAPTSADEKPKRRAQATDVSIGNRSRRKARIASAKTSLRSPATICARPRRPHTPRPGRDLEIGCGSRGDEFARAAADEERRDGQLRRRGEEALLHGGPILFTEREPSRNRGSQCQRQRPFESSRRFFFSPSSEAGLDGAANRRRQPRRPPRSRRSRRGRGRA